MDRIDHRIHRIAPVRMDIMTMEWMQTVLSVIILVQPATPQQVTVSLVSIQQQESLPPVNANLIISRSVHHSVKFAIINVEIAQTHRATAPPAMDWIGHQIHRTAPVRMDIMMMEWMQIVLHVSILV